MNDEIFNDANSEKPSHIPCEDWSGIDWSTAEEYVNRLQQRIVKATQAGNKNKVKRLQYLLTHSFYAKALAIKKVTSNRGKKTPGVDNEIWTTKADRWSAIKTLDSKGYHARPTRRVFIKKDNGKLRPLLFLPT